MDSTNKNKGDSTNENKGISRVDSGSTQGWFVRGYRNGKTYSKFFSDGKYKDKEEAVEKFMEKYLEFSISIIVSKVFMQIAKIVNKRICQ